MTNHYQSSMMLLVCGAVAGACAQAPEEALDTASLAVTVGRGMIVPAYLTLNDATTWNILREDAALITASAHPKDYWIIVNGPNNGPFAAGSAEWASAAAVWNPLRTAGGVLFGYVHTAATPSGPLFRSLAAVEADISAWVAGYPGLGGIFLDEFFPRYEIAGLNDTTATFPNGQALAPTNRSFLNANGTFNGQQVNPAGGYYDQLTSWIHGNFPGLKIIANPGGQFFSNQINYTELTDVTASFENTYSVAFASGWQALNRQNTTSTHGQLALIYANTTDLQGAVTQAFAKGYTYVYTTSRTAAENVWGGIPPYFTSEVQLIGDLP